MSNPILIEVLRGGSVESRHRGAFAIVESSGRVVAAAGDVSHPIYPRSAVKALQALPLIESGAAEAFGYGSAELALACASHNGEPRHVETARAMLKAAGLSEDHLECGPQPPSRRDDQAALAIQGASAGAIHNNCSGKHSGMLALACRCGVDPRGYVKRDHFVQREVRATIDSLCGAATSEDLCGVDGCSIPTWALPLDALARGFARFGTGDGSQPIRAAAAARLRRAVAEEPFMVAGTDRFCTRIMTALGEKAFVKTGAEGVFCAAFPNEGLGVALKIDDGAARASEAVMAALIKRFVTLDAEEERRLEPWLRPRLKNWNAIDVGEIRPVGPLA